MKAIVTGGAGFIGSKMVQRLRELDWDILIIDDFSTHTGPHRTIPGQRIQLGRTVQWFQQGNVSDVIIPKGFGTPDAIFHYASKLGPVGVLKFKGQIASDTIAGADRVGRWAHDYGCPLMYISTSEIYGNPDGANSEDTPKVFRDFSARSEYAVAKLASENMLVNMDDVDVRIIRPFNVTGAGQRADGGFVIPRFVQQALTGEALTVYVPGTQRRSFTHVEDINDGVMLAYKMGSANSIFNLGNDQNTRTILEVAQLVIDIAGSGTIQVVDPKTIHGDDFKEAPEKIPNAQKAMRELGFLPYRTIEQIIEESVEYERGRM